MNILMVHPHDIFSNLEPWTVRIVYIAREFANKGHSVKLIYFPLNFCRNAKIERDYNFDIIPLNRRLGAINFLKNVLFVIKTSRWADIIHFQKCFHWASIPSLVAGMINSKPIHYDWDDWEVKIYEISSQPGVLRNFIRNFLSLLECAIPKAVDTVSVSSNRLRIECEKLGVKKNRIFTAHVGADIERFNPAVSGENIRHRYGIKKPLILYLGQLHGGQYAELFIKAAFSLTNDYQYNLAFMIVGDGYQTEELKKLADRLNLNGKLIFAGAVCHTLVPEYIAAADICVASFEENDVTVCKSPLKVVEYLASGKAIVASYVGEVPDMIGEAGILTKPGDAQSLVSGIIKFLEDDDLRKNLGRLAREKAEKEYNWVVTAENLLSAYNAAIRAYKFRGNL